MVYLVHTANSQVVALWLCCVSWILTAMTLGLVQWRVWHVADRSVITSGKAWVGIWRVCFNSHTLVSPDFRVMFCRRIGLADAFTPPEIAAAQVLTFLALILGFCANASGIYALRSVVFGLKDSPIRAAFSVAGALCLLAAATSLAPLLWNLNSVVTNGTIDFPPDFHMPPAPASQHVGEGITVGIVASALMIISGIIFLTYRSPARSGHRIQPSPRRGKSLVGPEALANSRGILETGLKGKDNLGFESHEHL